MPASSSVDSSTLSYARIRLRWCARALVDLLRRWSVYLTVGVLVLGSSGNGAVAAMSGMTAWSVLPLFQATQSSPGGLALVVLAHSLVGAVVTWGLRPLLWPRAWAEAEAALPIAPRQQLQSDFTVVAFALVPLFCTYTAGALVWAGRSPSWMHGEWHLAIPALLMSMSLSIGWGVLIVQGMRRSPTSTRTPSTSRTSRAASTRPLSPWLVLVAWPMRRGPAGRTGRMFAWALAVLLACTTAPWRWPQWASWWLAAFAALSLVFTTRLNALATDELAALHAHCAPLPLDARTLLRARRAVAMLPQCVAQLALVASLVLARLPVRPAVLSACMLAMVAGSAMQVVSTTSVEGSRPADPAHRVSFWLFTLVLVVALATEVLR